MTWFALATYKTASRVDTPGVIVDGKLYEAKHVFTQGLAGVFADWPKAQAAVRQLGEDALAGKLRPAPERVDALTAPIRPTRIFCAAANYIEQANDYVAGYTVVNDISARDLNTRTDYPFKFDWFQGKSWDTFAPLGPWIVPAWLIPDPQTLQLKLTVNGEVMQQDSTANMIWNVREQVSYLSQILTLRPGDVIATGTPTGVGMARGIFLKHGDKVEATVEGIGTLANRVVDEQ